METESLNSLVVVIGLLAYLVYALLYPERF